MADATGKSTVVILGTMHLEPSSYPAYAGRLAEIIEQIKPDLICTELSPEQLAGTQTCNSKPEQRDVVMPTATRLGIPVVPIQMATDEARAWERGFKQAYKDIQSRDDMKPYLEFSDQLARQEAELWGDAMSSAACIENVQLNEYHVLSAARDNVVKKLMPDLAELYTEWNLSFLARIDETIRANPGKRILVIVGLWHKYWLWNELQTRDDIDLHNLQSFRQDQG